MILDNLKALKDDMVSKKWTICSFIFNYKEIEYIVLVKRFVGAEKRISDYALVKLHFMKSADLKDDLEVEANSNGLLIDSKKLRQYFGIEYQENLGDVLRQFTERLGNEIPPSVPDSDSVSQIEKKAMVQSLSKSDSEDPNKIYCTKVKRNPNQGQRSEFNSDKTKLLRESLFEHFRNNSEISFCYSLDAEKENNDAAILRNFANNNSM
ncbi:hypothetical protein M2454_001791 [Aequitasia blattaphilus]|uniref:DUF6037 family protein n=1 Tax=Aequitasia blattaphilus TaxID=2949332 RepID=A0ABT1E919_9FIRM|nr:DUF6037 family protein [Aequitasia blattaphilus]MCP1102334.1 DUF6037 family protein [Aequitasia blattaphilus]MCR8614974.1 DUF6037 family protein [Aequitasia blattaphilus]